MARIILCLLSCPFCCLSAVAAYGQAPNWVVYPEKEWRVLTPEEAGVRDGQYSSNDTGLKPSPAPMDQVERRKNWRKTVSDEVACVKTLRYVIEAVRDSP